MSTQEEKKPLPALAITAIRMATVDYERTVQAIAAQILEGMALNPSDGWQVNFTDGVAVRTIEEPIDELPERITERTMTSNNHRS